MGGWFRKEIKTVDDLKGLKMRIGGLPGTRAAEARRACRSRSPAATSIRRWKRARIDAAEWVGPYDDEKLGFYKVAPHYYYPGWWEGGSMLFTFVNLDKWNALPKNYQAVLEQAAALRQHVDAWRSTTQLNPPALRRLLANGAKLHGFSPAIMEACYKAAKELHAEIAKENASFKKVNELDERLHATTPISGSRWPN